MNIFGNAAVISSHLLSAPVYSVISGLHYLGNITEKEKITKNITEN